ncbi:hypothetical protein FSP39_007706 [Pinctada imbricata]|uniref:TIR domain-containing protein n=1 Tax=Pinctada imbricata TaxID=66713 RepID=A0AA88Y828_PINIB|nr:hypothetical protein FSP39_007706 [Pinctada imbricata]
MPNSSPPKVLYCPEETCYYKAIHKQKCCHCEGFTDWEYHNRSLGELSIKLNPKNYSFGEVINRGPDENLYKLRFNGRLLTFVPEKICDFRELVIVELRNNLIRDIGNISCFNTLDTLVLSGNYIREIKAHTFKYNRNLRILDLSYNMLATMSSDFLPPMALSFLILHHNYFRSYDVSNLGIMMNRPFCLIDISYNILTEETITNKQNLTFEETGPAGQGSINFQHNWISTFPGFVLEVFSFKKCQEASRLWDYKVDLRNNPIQCDCKLVPIMEMVQPLLSFADHIFHVYLNISCFYPPYLKGISIYSIIKTGNWEHMTCPLTLKDDCPRGCECKFKLSVNRVNFLSAEKIVFVNCTAAGLYKLPHKIPKGDKYYLFLSKNTISDISPRYYFRFTKILNLSENRLYKIDSTSVELMLKIEKIILTNNMGLVKIPENVKLLNPCRVKFPNVHFVCTCKNIWIKDWLMKSHSSNTGKKACNIDNFFCKTKTKVIRLVEFNADRLFCDREYDIYARDVLITSITLILSSIVALWTLSYFRFEIVILLRKRYFTCTYRSMSRRRHEYDVFISFDEQRVDIRKWVMKELIPMLQKEDYSFYVPTISLPIGEIRTEEIERVVLKCQNYIVVLSDEYFGEGTIWNFF